MVGNSSTVPNSNKIILLVNDMLGITQQLFANTDTSTFTLTFGNRYDYPTFRMPEEEILTPSEEAKAEKISVPKLIKQKMNTHEGYKARKEYWK